jgi:hypothetical protein
MKRLAMPVIVLMAAMAAATARAGVMVGIAGGADRDARFWVVMRSSHGFIHGSYGVDIDARFMHPGETATIPVPALNPVTFSYVHAAIYHPAYMYDSKLVKELPSAFSTVDIPVFVPRSWRAFIDSGELVVHAGPGVHLGHVIGHFSQFLKPYLPAADDAGIAQDPAQYVPLLEEIIAHTKRTLPQSTYGDRRIDELRKNDPSYAQRLDLTEQRRLVQLDEMLVEIKALVAVGRGERIRLRAMQAKLASTAMVYHELMSGGDRQAVEAFLDVQFENSRARPAPEKARQWVSGETRVAYVITLGARYSLNNQSGKRLYDDCYRTKLKVDLLSGGKTNLKNVQKGFGANFCRDDKNEWVIQLPRR